MKNEKSFRKTVAGGFNTRDVVEYLSKLSREHREEVEALRAGAEKLRKERDAALAGRNIVPLPAPASDEFADDPVGALVMERDTLRKENGQLREALVQMGVSVGDSQDPLANFVSQEERVRWDEERARWEEERAQRAGEQAFWQEERERWTEERTRWEEERARLREDQADREEERVRWQAERADWQMERVRWQAEKSSLDALRQELEDEKLGLDESLSRMGSVPTASPEEVESLRRQIQALTEEKTELLIQREDWFEHQPGSEAISPETEALSPENDVLLLENENFLQEKDALLLEKEALLQERDALLSEKDALLQEREALSQEKETLLQERQTAWQEKQSILQEKDRLAYENTMLIQEKAGLLMDLSEAQERQEQREKEAEDRSYWMESLPEITAERDRLLVEAARHGDEKAALNSIITELNRQVVSLKQEITEKGLRIEMIQRREQEEAVRLENFRNRSESIERDIDRSISETRAKFSDVMAFGNSAALSVVLELDKMRDYFTRFSDVFAATEDSVNRLEGSRKQLVRAFVPGEFFEESLPPVGDSAVTPLVQTPVSHAELKNVLYHAEDLTKPRPDPERRVDTPEFGQPLPPEQILQSPPVPVPMSQTQPVPAPLQAQPAPQAQAAPQPPSAPAPRSPIIETPVFPVISRETPHAPPQNTPSQYQ